MNKIFFAKKSEMTDFADKSGLEFIRCKQKCLHFPFPTRPAILIINQDETIHFRLVKCKVCANANETKNEIPNQVTETGELKEGGI